MTTPKWREYVAKANGPGEGLPGPFFFALHAYGGASGGLLAPESDLPEGLGESVDDDGGLAVAEALDGEVGGLFGVVGGVPQADDDAIVGQMQADALADGAGLGEGKGGEGRDEDDGVGFVGERVENLAGDGGGRKVESLVVGPLHELDEHVGGEFVGLIAGGDADYSEVFLLGEVQGREGRGGFFGAVVGEFGYELADGEEEEVAADVVEVALMAILFHEGEGGDEYGVVELDEGPAFEEAVGDGVGLLLVHGEEALVEESFGGEFGVGAEEGVEEG
jgi:hypothetical protein